MLSKINKTGIKKFQLNLIHSQTKILKRIDTLKKNDPFADPDHAIDNAAVDTDVREQIGHDTIVAEIEASMKHLNLIDLALKKIIKGNFGICEKCKNPIPVNRLNLVPETRYCIICEKKLIK